jgi:hypothetical protein
MLLLLQQQRKIMGITARDLQLNHLFARTYNKHKEQKRNGTKVVLGDHIF